MKVLMVDDEAAARETLRRFCAELTDVEVVGECDRGDEAIARIRELMPELVFLDIQMRQVGAAATPMTVFVTAYDRYAVEAFELNAVDFLLKPFSRERFQATIDRLRERLATRDSGALARWRATLEAAGNYIVVQTRASEQFILRRRILDAEEWLDPGLFLRIHRSRVVNLRAIREIVPSGNGDFVLTLQSGKQVESGRSYRHHVVELLRGWGNGAPGTA